LFRFIRHRKKIKVRLLIIGGSIRGTEKLRSIHLRSISNKCKPIALSSLPCPAPILILFVILLSVGGLVFSPQKKDNHKHLASRKEVSCLVCAFLLFRWLLLSDSLRLRDKKKYFKAKRKTLFYFKIFTYRGEKRGKDERVKAGNKDKEQCTHRINSNLPGGSIAGERILLF